MTFGEIGHFYTDELFVSTSLDFLKDVELPSFDRTALFIDDYNPTNHVLDIAQLHRKTEQLITNDVELHFESDMVAYFDDVMMLFGDKDIVTTKYKRSTIEKFELALGDTRITLAQVYPDFRPTCAMLSLTWTLYRLGVVGNSKCSESYTLIDQKYFNVEQRVLTLLKYLEHKGHVRTNNVHYQFYTTH